MAIVIVQQPDTLSLSGNLKDLVVQTGSALQVTLSTGSDTVLDETYYPGNGNLVHLNFSDVINAYLAYSLPNTDIYLQTKLSAAFTVSLANDTNNTTLSFSAIKGGKLHLNESAFQFLKGNFLTWQPNLKPVTYYSPEWLTYYATSACSIILKAYWEDGSTSTKTLVSPSAGNCYSINLQYAVVSGMFDGKRPMYYDVWVESGGARLTYVQRYVASELQADNEHWFLFENSLGGMDSVRAYGSQTDDPDYDYHMALRGNEGENYRIDVERVRSVNTGYLTPEETRWLQDLFATRKAYVYTATGLYPIVLTAGEGATEGDDEPSSFSFGYRFADVRPYLDIQRRTDLPENLIIPVPTGETFFLPPRLAEFPKQALSPDLLIPVEEPHTEAWGTLTAGMLHDSVLNGLIAYLDGLTVQPYSQNLIKVGDTTPPTDFNVFSAARTLKEIEALAGSSKPSSLWLLDKSEEYFHLSEDGLNALLRKNFISFGDVVAYSNKDFTPTLPIASPSNYGLVKYDGTTLKVDDEGRLYVAGGGNSGIDFEVGDGLELTSDNYLNVLFGTTSNTACAGNDARLSDARRNPYSLSWSGYSSGSYDGASVAKIEIPNNTNQLTNGAGFISDANGFISKIYGTGHANQYLAGDGIFYTIAYSELSGTPDLSVFVTLNTDQTITGLKTFEQNILSKQDIIAYSDSSKLPTLPIASASSYGLVKIDGVTLQYDENGRLYVAGGGSGGGISSVIPSGSGNAVTGLIYDGSSKSLTYQLGNSFLPLNGGTMNNAKLVGNLNADMLDGLHASDFVIRRGHVPTSMANVLGYGYEDEGWKRTGPIISFGDPSYYAQIQTSHNNVDTVMRINNNGVFSDWKAIAFTDGTIANADMVDGYHESAFLRYRGETGTDQESTLWHSLGIKQYSNALPDGLTGVYNYGEVISLTGGQARFDMYVAHTSTNTYYEHGIWVRSGWVDDKKPWRRLAFITDTIAAANKLSTTRYLWGQSFDGSGNVNGVMNFINQGNLITVGGDNCANNIVLSTGYDTTNGDWTKLGVAGAGSNSAGIILTHRGRVGIGVDYPTHDLHINGAIKAKYNPDYNLAHDIVGETHFYNDSYSDPATNIRAAIKVNGVIAQSSGNVLLCTTSGNVGIGITTPEHKLDVNGSVVVRGPMAVKGTIFMPLNTYLFMADENTGIYLSDYGIYWHNSDNTYHSSIMTCDGSVTTIYKPLYIESDVHLTGSDQINGTWGGLALNYNCGKYVDTSIWNGQAKEIMRVFGEAGKVAIGPSAIASPLGRLNVDGDVYFENARFITTSGFTDGDHAYSHAIYGGCHGIDVCEFYENRFHFRNNGGNIYLLQLTTDYASFCGAVYSSLSAFVGSWGNKERIRLTRDGEFNTWLQAGTDTTAENGRLYMSGLEGTLLHKFNVFASVSNFKGSIIAEGDVTAYSDIRLKNRIESVNNVLDTIDTLDVFRYTWKDREDKSVHIGVSAQQVQTIYPEFVLTSSPEDGTDYLTVNYAALATCIAIQGIKELAKKGDERDKKIVSLETEIKNLKERIKTLEAWS